MIVGPDVSWFLWIVWACIIAPFVALLLFILIMVYLSFRRE